MNEGTGIKGHVKVELRDELGNMKHYQEFPNTITNVFDAHAAARLSGVSDNIISFIAIGSGDSQAAVDTTLDHLINIVALSGTTGSILQLTGANDNDLQAVGYWGAGAGTGSITEAGLFKMSGTTLGSMCAYTDSINVQKGASDTLTLTWTLTLGSS